MLTTVHAIYENQPLQLDAPLPVQNGANVEVILNLPEISASPRQRFSWEEGPILSGDSY